MLAIGNTLVPLKCLDPKCIQMHSYGLHVYTLHSSEGQNQPDTALEVSQALICIAFSGLAQASTSLVGPLAPLPPALCPLLSASAHAYSTSLAPDNSKGKKPSVPTPTNPAAVSVSPEKRWSSTGQPWAARARSSLGAQYSILCWETWCNKVRDRTLVWTDFGSQ